MARARIISTFTANPTLDTQLHCHFAHQPLNYLYRQRFSLFLLCVYKSHICPFMTPTPICIIEIVVQFLFIFSILSYNVVKVEAISYSPFIPTDVQCSILLIVITQQHLLNKFNSLSCILFTNIKLHKLCLYNLQTLICTNYNCRGS